MLQATLEDVAARGLSDAITFKALSTGIKTVGKVRNILQERNLAKQSLRFAQLMTEDSPANVIAITKHEYYAQDLRNAWRRAIDRIRNPHTEVVTTEGMVVKVPKKGNLHLMEGPGNSSGKQWKKPKNPSSTPKELIEKQLPAFIQENKVPSDAQTILANPEFKRTNKPTVKGAKIYENGKFYYHRDTLHTGKRAHLEVYRKKGGKKAIHIGEADPITGILIPNTADKAKDLTF